MKIRSIKSFKDLLAWVIVIAVFTVIIRVLIAIPLYAYGVTAIALAIITTIVMFPPVLVYLIRWIRWAFRHVMFPNKESLKFPPDWEFFWVWEEIFDIICDMIP